METKTCTKCGIEKDISDFKLRSDNKSKRKSQCRHCDNEYLKLKRQEKEFKERELANGKRYREENKDKRSEYFRQWSEDNYQHRKEYMDLWREEKRLDPEWVEQERQKSRERAAIGRKENPEIVNQRKAAYRDRNRELLNAKNRQHYYETWEQQQERKRLYEQTEQGKITRRLAASRRMARKKGASGDYKKEDFLSLFEEGDQSCYLCGCSINQFDFHIEHKTPLSRGGSNEIENIGISCMTCNTRKGSKTEEEFREYLINNPYKVPEYRPKAAGQHHGNAKLTLEEVLNLRQEFIVGVHTCRLWAEFYNVSERVISKIITGKSWMLPEAIPDGWKPIDKLPKNGNWSKKTSK